MHFEAWTTAKLPAVIDEPPLLDTNPRELVWADGCKRLWIQTDNKLIADAFAGNATLSAAYLQPLCIRIGRNLAMLLHTGWRPRLDTEAFIEWDARSFNAVADHAANSALDNHTDWDRLGSDHLLVTTSQRWRLCVDGAYRGDGTAAAGVAIYYYDEGGSRHMVAR